MKIAPVDFGEREDAGGYVFPIAGLQFYSYCENDDIIGRVMPSYGDRLQLIRTPGNPYDVNAIEVWFRNGQFKLGHVPRWIVKFLAPNMDSGKDLRAYSVATGNGNAWSVPMVLFGAAFEGIPSYLLECSTIRAYNEKIHS